MGAHQDRAPLAGAAIAPAPGGAARRSSVVVEGLEQLGVLDEVPVAEDGRVRARVRAAGLAARSSSRITPSSRSSSRSVRSSRRSPLSPWTIWSWMPPTRDARPGLPHRLGHGEAEALDALLDHDGGVALQGVHEVRILVDIVHGQAAQVQPVPMPGRLPPDVVHSSRTSAPSGSSPTPVTGPTSIRWTSSRKRARWLANPVSTPAMSLRRSQRLTWRTILAFGGSGPLP